MQENFWNSIFSYVEFLIIHLGAGKTQTFLFFIDSVNEIGSIWPRVTCMKYLKEQTTFKTPEACLPCEIENNKPDCIFLQFYWEIIDMWLYFF